MVYHLFYLVGIFYLIRELIDLLHPLQYASKMRMLYEMSDKNKENKKLNLDDITYQRLSPNEKNALWYGVFSLIYVLWMFVGLFTSEWIIFLSFIIFSFLIYSPIVKVIRTKLGLGKAYITAHIIATLIDIALILFAMINHYHLHIDLLNLFLNLFR
jgi:hypothetical protein